MSLYRRMALIVFTAGLAACNEHTALNTKAKISLPPAAITQTSVELILANATVIGPDGQRAEPAASGALLPAATQKVALKVCKGTPHSTVTQVLQMLQAREVSVSVDSAAPARCG